MTQKQKEDYHGVYKLGTRLYLFLMFANGNTDVVFSTQNLEVRTQVAHHFFRNYKKVSDVKTWEEFNNQITQGHKQHNFNKKLSDYLKSLSPSEINTYNRLHVYDAVCLLESELND